MRLISPPEVEETAASVLRVSDQVQSALSGSGPDLACDSALIPSELVQPCNRQRGVWLRCGHN